MTYPPGRPTLHQAFHMERRLARRQAVGFPALLCGSGLRLDVDVTDLSTLGFRTETSYPLLPGSIVWLTLPGAAELEATVAWREHYSYGCPFRIPLQPAVLDRIIASGRS